MFYKMTDFGKKYKNAFLKKLPKKKKSGAENIDQNYKISGKSTHVP